MAAMFVHESGQNEQFYKGPSIDASYQVSVHFKSFFIIILLKIIVIFLYSNIYPVTYAF
jgi:hypothetical protein